MTEWHDQRCSFYSSLPNESLMRDDISKFDRTAKVFNCLELGNATANAGPKRRFLSITNQYKKAIG